MIQKILGYVAIPHALLHVLAYRLIGKPCTYQFGNRHIRPLGERSPGERAFVLLFPPLVTGGAGAMLLTVWLLTFVSAGYQPDPLLYYSTAPAGHQVLWWGALALLAYAGTAIYGIVLGVKILLHELGHYPPEQGSEYDRCRI